MKGEDQATKTKAALMADTTGKMDRRKFVVTAAKMLIPTLGIIGLNLFQPSSVQAATCSNSCTGDCGTRCNHYCAANCMGKMPK